MFVRWDLRSGMGRQRAADCYGLFKEKFDRIRDAPFFPEEVNETKDALLMFDSYSKAHNIVTI